MKYFIICLVFIALSSCASNSESPEAFAKKFCNCSEKLGKAIVDNKEKKLSDKEFEKILKENQACMGPSDPRSALNPEELEKFEAAYKKAILKQCPKIGRSYGYNQ
jgi:hypothetical protein